MSAELIGLISVIIITIGNSVHTGVKSYFDNKYKKNNEEKLSSRDVILTGSLRDLEKVVISTNNDVGNVTTVIKELKEENDFEHSLSSSIMAIGCQITSSNYALNYDAQNIATFITKQINELAFIFYYAPYRNSPDEMEGYLRKYIEKQKASTKIFIDSTYKGIKVFKGKKYKLSTFLNDMDTLKGIDKYISCNSLMELLLLDLKKNGYSRDKTISEFTKFVSKYLESLIKTILKFDNLDDQ